MIAIVDDDEFVCESAKALVESLGYEAFAFSSAENFLLSDHLHSTSCLITDVQMPGQSGLDLLEHLTRRGFHIPAIVVSAFLNEKNCGRALKAHSAVCQSHTEKSL